MDLIKELQCAKANFDSAKQDYIKAHNELLTGLLADCNLLDVDCECKGKVGQLKVVATSTHYEPHELQFYPYTAKGELSKKANGFWLWLDYCKDMDDFVNKLASNGICAVHDTPFDVLKKEKDKDLEQICENSDFER